MTISGQVQILQCLQFLEVRINSSDLAIVQEQNQSCLPVRHGQTRDDATAFFYPRNSILSYL
jgi:hypothetical protein